MGGPIACAVVNCRLDYANAMLYVTSKSNIDKLQRVRNAMAKIVTNTRRISQHIKSNQINLFRHTQQIYTIYKTKVTKTFILCVTRSTQGA